MSIACEVLNALISPRLAPSERLPGVWGRQRPMINNGSAVSVASCWSAPARSAWGSAAAAAHYVPVTRNLKGGRTARNAAEFRQRHVIGGF